MSQIKYIYEILKLCKSMPSFTIPVGVKILAGSLLTGFGCLTFGKFFDVLEYYPREWNVRTFSLGVTLGTVASPILCAQSKTHAAIITLSATICGIAGIAGANKYNGRTLKSIIEYLRNPDSDDLSTKTKEIWDLAGAIPLIPTATLAGAMVSASLISR